MRVAILAHLLKAKLAVEPERLGVAEEVHAVGVLILRKNALYKLPRKPLPPVSLVRHYRAELYVNALLSVLQKAHYVRRNVGQQPAVLRKRIRDILPRVIAAAHPVLKIKPERAPRKVVEHCALFAVVHIVAYKFHSRSLPPRTSYTAVAESGYPAPLMPLISRTVGSAERFHARHSFYLAVLLPAAA